VGRGDFFIPQLRLRHRINEPSLAARRWFIQKALMPVSSRPIVNW
jgi:hypothetical protein